MEDKKEKKTYTVDEEKLRFNNLFQIISYVYSCETTEPLSTKNRTSVNMAVLESTGYSFNEVISMFTYFTDVLSKDNNTKVRSIELVIGYEENIDKYGLYLAFSHICKKKYAKKEKQIPMLFSHFTKKSYEDLLTFLNEGVDFKHVTIRNDFCSVCCENVSVIDLFIERANYCAKKYSDFKKDILPEAVKIALELNEKD